MNIYLTKASGRLYFFSSGHIFLLTAALLFLRTYSAQHLNMFIIRSSSNRGLVFIWGYCWAGHTNCSGQFHNGLGGCSGNCCICICYCTYVQEFDSIIRGIQNEMPQKASHENGCGVMSSSKILAQVLWLWTDKLFHNVEAQQFNLENELGNEDNTTEIHHYGHHECSNNVEILLDNQDNT